MGIANLAERIDTQTFISTGTMRQTFYGIAFTTFLLLFLLIAGFWIRSLMVFDGAIWGPLNSSPNRSLMIDGSSGSGLLAFQIHRSVESPSVKIAGWRAQGLTISSGSKSGYSWWHECPLGFRFRCHTSRTKLGGTDFYLLVIVPEFFLMIFPLLAALLLLRLYRRACHRRRFPDACPRCGYDLRASPARCPECGEIPRRTLHVARNAV